MLIRSMQNSNLTGQGELQINVTDTRNIPINNATINIYYSGEPGRQLEQLRTNASGKTGEIILAAPPEAWSLDVNNILQPYSEYTIVVSAEGYEPQDISGIEILANTDSVQDVRLEPATPLEEGSNIVIPAHTLYGEYPPKIPEDAIKPMDTSGEIVLSRVVVPETVIVHDGVPSDPTAKDYYVPYTDYIKNVASSEIYATWPESTIIANVLAIMSFTLNRVYTEW